MLHYEVELLHFEKSVNALAVRRILRKSLHPIIEKLFFFLKRTDQINSSENLASGLPPKA